MIKAWDELSVIEQLQCEFSDAYKDAYGYRPIGITDLCWNDETWLRQELTILHADVSRLIEAERKSEQRAAERFENMVADTIAVGAGDRETALRWIFEAEGVDSESNFDLEFYCHRHGLAYDYFQSSVAQSA